MAVARKGRERDRDALALFADELRAHRTARGWTQADVAAKTAYSESLIAQVETRHKSATPELAKALDRVFGTPGFAEDADGGQGSPGTFGRLVARLRNMPFPGVVPLLRRARGGSRGIEHLPALAGARPAADRGLRAGRPGH
jgi:transcriptional regulator with XRE-family HTH domain